MFCLCMCALLNFIKVFCIVLHILTTLLIHCFLVLCLPSTRYQFCITVLPHTPPCICFERTVRLKKKKKKQKHTLQSNHLFFSYTAGSIQCMSSRLRPVRVRVAVLVWTPLIGSLQPQKTLPLTAFLLRFFSATLQHFTGRKKWRNGFRYTSLIRNRLQIKSYGNSAGAHPLKCAGSKQQSRGFIWNNTTFFFFFTFFFSPFSPSMRADNDDLIMITPLL